MAPPHVCVTSFRMLLRHMDIKSPHYHHQLATQCRRMHFMATAACGSSNNQQQHHLHQQQTTPAAATILTARRSTAPRRHIATGTATNFSQTSWHLSRRHYSSSDVKSGVGDLISKEKGAPSVDTPKETPPEAPTTTNTTNHTDGMSPKPSHEQCTATDTQPSKAATPIKEDDGNGNGCDVDGKMGQIKVADLKAEMRALGLGVSGNKQQLIQRLREHRLQQQQRQQQHNHQQQMHHEAHESDGPDPLAVAQCMSPLTEIESAKTKGEVFVEFIQGLPHLTVPLPSRNEKCRFALMPVNHKVGDLIDMLKEEDRGIDRATVLNQSGVRIASTCSIESLMDEPFWLQINDNKYKVEPPQRIRAQTEDLNRLGDVRSLVAQLYEALHVNEYHISKEKELAGRLEKLQFELTPLEERKTELSSRAERRNAFLTWFGLGLMSVQFGILARLTWWEYSWDIMEPVTYFVTYGTTIAFYAYYCVTKVEYNFTDVKNREYLLYVHKQARKSKFDIEKYNTLKREIADVEYDLRRLRDPLNLQLSPQVYRTVADQGTPPPLGPGDGSAAVASDAKATPSGGALKGFKIPFLDTKN